jgi:hypothetical protein
VVGGFWKPCMGQASGMFAEKVHIFNTGRGLYPKNDGIRPRKPKDNNSAKEAVINIWSAEPWGFVTPTQGVRDYLG